MVQTDWRTPFHQTDTGYVIQGGAPRIFDWLISRNGGIASIIDSMQTGTLIPVSPFIYFDQWNVIGISWGDRGVKIMANGKLVDSSGIAVSPLTNDLGSLNIGNHFDPTDFRRMSGAVKDVRFSFKENDFTFSAKSPWLGADTGHVQKTICFSQL
jgi:hypothetical protein